MKISKYISIIWAILALTSCEDFIDNPPEDQISINDYFTTANDVDNYVKKFYEVFPGHGNATLPISENDSDNLILTVPNEVLNGTRALQTGSWEDSEAYVWDNIRAVNILFDNLDGVEDDISSYSQSLGEAYFFRAWFYFRLLTTYGDVPLYTSELLPGDEDLTLPRSPRNEVANFILLDLDNAYIYLEDRSTVGNAMLNKETALAFQTQVALYEGSWQKYHSSSVFGTEGVDPTLFFQKAVESAGELINGSYTRGIYNTGNPDTDYYTLFGLDDMSNIDEVLFYKIADSDQGLGHNLQLYVTRDTRNMSLTWSLISSYLTKDGTPYDFLGLASTTKGNAFLTKISTDCDPRLSATIWAPDDLRVASDNTVFEKPGLNGGSDALAATGFQVKKFSNPYSDAAGADYGGYSETGRIYFRYGEVLLNYAEALYELNGTVAYGQLNLLRSRVGMPDFSVIPQVEYGSNLLDYGYAIEDALYAIRNERRVELALEGQRPLDYKRWAAHALFQGNRPLGYPFEATEFPDYSPTLDGNGLIDYFQSDMPAGYGFQEGRDYLTSIPQGELTLNPNLEQNPGW